MSQAAAPQPSLPVMIDSFMVKDNFCQHPHEVRHSALEAGFGTWKPEAKGIVGSSNYEGMGFKGLHATLLRSLAYCLNKPVYPNSMFFRVTKPGTERAYVHSDRADGHWTCLCYLSEHPDEQSGTGFYRHRKTGLLEMPSFADILNPKSSEEAAMYAELKRDMVEGGEEEWELTDFVRGHFNRAIIFHAPLFHARHPLHGIGDGSDEAARMIWATHFYI